MIELRIDEIKIGKSETGLDNFNKIMSKLSQVLDKERFCGTITMKYEHGKMMYLNINQGFTVGELNKSLNL
jgi:hypothetical protein